MDKIKKIIGFFFASMFLFIVLSPTSMLKMPFSILITCVFFQSFTIIALSKFSKGSRPFYLFIAILLGGCIIDIIIRICYFEYTMLSLPKSIAEIASVTVGYLVFKWISRYEKTKLDNFREKKS